MTSIRLAPWIVFMLRKHFGLVWEQFDQDQRRWVELLASDGMVDVPLTDDEAGRFLHRLGSLAESIEANEQARLAPRSAGADGLDYKPVAIPEPRSKTIPKSYYQPLQPREKAIRASRQKRREAEAERLRQQWGCDRTRPNDDPPTYSTLLGGDINGFHPEVVPFWEMEQVPTMGPEFIRYRREHGRTH